MARPPKIDGMPYFQHDSDARHDYKVGALRHRFGPKGYAFYFILLEILYQSPRAEINVLAHETIPYLAHEVGVTPEEFEEMMLFAINLNLFGKNEWEMEKTIVSAGVRRRFQQYTKRRVVNKKNEGQ